MGLFLKNWRFLLDVLIVLALVVGLFVWNPFGIFGGGLKLQDTTNMVTEVRQIGQLVTAEYYGEVIASIDEARLNLIENDNIKVRAEVLFINLRGALRNLKNFQDLPKEERDEVYDKKNPINNWRRIIRYEVARGNIIDKLNFHGFLDEVAMDGLYDDMLEFILREKSDIKKNEKWNPSQKNKEDALLLLYESLGKNEFIFDSQKFMNFYYQDKKADFSRKELRKKLAMVGRGWVKAGFDFTNLDPSAIVIYDDVREVHIFGLAPTILNADINPWFIPEKGIPGFEILDYNGLVDFKDAKKVKEYCVEKLMTFAHRAEILKNAEIQGVETLKNLFSLITGKEVKKVVFHHDPLTQLLAEVERDQVVNRYELTLVDSLLQLEINNLDSLIKNINAGNSQIKTVSQTNQLSQSQQFRNIEQKKKNIFVVISRLQQLEMLGTNMPYSYFSRTVLDIASDSILDDKELASLKKLRMEWELNNRIEQFGTVVPFPMYFWYDDPAAYMTDFNLIIKSLIRQNLAFGNIETETLDTSKVDSNYLARHWVLNYNKISEKEMVLTLIKNPINADNKLTHFYYPFNYDRNLIAAFIESNLIEDYGLEKTKKITLSDSLKYWKIYNGDKQLHLMPEVFLNLLLPVQKEAALKNGFLKIGNQYSIFADKKEFKQLESDKLFSVEQNKELDNFIRLLSKQRQDYQSKGALEKANRWVQNKLKERRATPTWLTSLRETVDMP